MINNNQTFITKLEDNNNTMIKFERWNYKKASTVEQKAKEFYKSFDGLFLKDAIKEGATKLSIYKTESNGDNEILVKTLSIKEIEQ